MVHSHRSLRRVVVSSVSLSLLGGMYIAAGALGTGCGSSDDSPSTTAPLDAGHDAADATTPPSGDDSGSIVDDDGAVDASTFLSVGVKSAGDVYAGQSMTFSVQPNTFDAGVLTYKWTLTKAPPGSAVTQASLVVSSDGTQATLPTDHTGDYAVTLDVASGDGAGSVTAPLHAYPAGVVYAKSETLADGGFVGTGWVVGSDGTNGHAFTCPAAVPPLRTDESGDMRIYGVAKVGADLFENLANNPISVVYGGVPYGGDGGTYAPLVLTDTGENCTGSDAGARTLYTGFLTGADSASALHPRFSPDGTKVLFTIANTNPPNTGIDTSSFYEVVNSDGSTPITIASVVDKDAGIDENPNVSITRQAEWIDATHVGWIRYNQLDAGISWDVVTSSVPPVAGEPKIAMTCTLPGQTPNRVVFLKDGSMLVAVEATNNGPVDLLVLAPATNGTCTVVRNLSKLGATAQGQAGVIAFALSPDQKTVAYSACDPVVTDSCGSGATEQDLLYTVPTDGTAAPAVAPGKPLSAAGVRWAGGGTAIVFSRFPGTDAGGPTDGVPTVAVVPFQASTDAGIRGDVAIGDAATAVTAVGSGDNGCNASGSGSAPFGSMLLGVVGLAFLRRRKSAAFSSEV